MNIGNNSRDKSKNLSNKNETKKGVYTSYNSIAGRTEVKSVSQAMRDYISNGFAKLAPPHNKS